MNPDKILIIFESTRAVVVAEQQCKKHGFDCLAVPTPKKESAQCGIALEIPISQKNEVLELLTKLGKPFKFFEG